MESDQLSATFLPMGALPAGYSFHIDSGKDRVAVGLYKRGWRQKRLLALLEEKLPQGEHDEFIGEAKRKLWSDEVNRRFGPAGYSLGI